MSKKARMSTPADDEEQALVRKHGRPMCDSMAGSLKKKSISGYKHVTFQAFQRKNGNYRAQVYDIETDKLVHLGYFYTRPRGGGFRCAEHDEGLAGPAGRNTPLREPDGRAGGAGRLGRGFDAGEEPEVGLRLYERVHSGRRTVDAAPFPHSQQVQVQVVQPHAVKHRTQLHLGRTRGSSDRPPRGKVIAAKAMQAR